MSCLAARTDNLLFTGRWDEVVDWLRREVPELCRKLVLTVRGGIVGAEIFE